MRTLIFLLAAAIAPFAPTAHAEPPTDITTEVWSAALSPAVAVGPHWVRRPKSQEVENVYPTRATYQGIGGSALMRCDVAPDGHMANCVIVSESPLGEGFGKAALSLARFFRIGGPIPPNAIVNIPVGFRPSPY